MFRKRTSTEVSDSVSVANAILTRCFKKKIPITFGQLERAVLRVESLCLVNFGVHAIADHEYPAITWKNDTVDRGRHVTHYIPQATGPKQAAKPQRVSSLHLALKQVVVDLGA